jgi:Long-chain fatty acid transport protein
MKNLLASTVPLFCLASASFGAGFSLFEGSAAGNADPNFATAKGGEPGALFFNPAAIDTLKGSQLQVGVTFVAPTFSVEGRNPYTGQSYKTDAKDQVFPIPHAYYTRQLSDELWLGLSFTSRFGMGTEFADDWFGRYNSIKADILSLNLSPSIAWKATDWLTVAAGFTAQYFDITLKQKIDAANRTNNPENPVAFDVSQELSADSFGFGANLGLVLRPVDKVAIGLAYHSRIKQDAEGEATYKKHPAVAAGLASKGQGMLFTDTDAKGSVTLPDTFVSALTYDATDKLTLGIGATYQTWSTYDELKIEFDKPVIGRSESASEKDWNNVFRYAFSGTYQLTDTWTLRASYIYDKSPVNANHVEYILPSGSRDIFAIGAGCVLGAWTLDVSYFYEIMDDGDVLADVGSGVMPSKYVDGEAHSVGFSATRRF